jgi:hypothetical protein
LALIPALSAIATPLHAERGGAAIGDNNWIERTGTGFVGSPASIDDVLDCLLGPDVSVSNVQVTGAPDAIGLFSGGSSVIGFEEGVVLSTGNVGFITGPNMADSTSQANGLPGDADLDVLVAPFPTFDATVLQFDFSCVDPVSLSFTYVFASEEYNEFVDTSFNDVFAFFVNGTAVTDNIAVVPASCSDGGIPVAINNVICRNPFAGAGPSCNRYPNNDLQDGGGAIGTEMDGRTEVFVATTTVEPGTNSIKIAIADAGDFVWDSNVFLKCESFVCEPPEATGPCCLLEERDCIVTTEFDCALALGVYLGDGGTCEGNPCTVPIEKSSWSEIKSTFR